MTRSIPETAKRLICVLQIDLSCWKSNLASPDFFFPFKNAKLPENVEVPARKGQCYFGLSLKTVTEKGGRKTEVDTSGMLFSGSWRPERLWKAGKRPEVCKEMINE